MLHPLFLSWWSCSGGCFRWGLFPSQERLATQTKLYHLNIYFIDHSFNFFWLRSSRANNVVVIVVIIIVVVVIVIDYVVLIAVAIVDFITAAGLLVFLSCMRAGRRHQSSKKNSTRSSVSGKTAVEKDYLPYGRGEGESGAYTSMASPPLSPASANSVKNRRDTEEVRLSQSRWPLLMLWSCACASACRLVYRYVVLFAKLNFHRATS